MGVMYSPVNVHGDVLYANVIGFICCGAKTKSLEPLALQRLRYRGKPCGLGLCRVYVLDYSTGHI